MNTRAVIAVILALAQPSWPDALSEQIKHLATITDETAAIDAMRDFRDVQEALIEWDNQLAQQYREGGEDALASAKAEDVRNRLIALSTGWKHLLERYPDSPRVNNYYGEYLYDHTRDQAEAVRYWSRAVSIDPVFAPAHNNLGVHYLHSGGPQLGLQHLQTAVEIDPAHADYLYNITQAYFNYRREVMRLYGFDEKKVYETAMKYSQRAAEIAPDDLEIVQDYAVNFFAAPDFRVKPDWSAALAAWDRVLPVTREPVQKFYVLLNKARVYMRMSKWEDAIAVLEESLMIQPESEAATNLLAECRNRVADGGKKKKNRD